MRVLLQLCFWAMLAARSASMTHLAFTLAPNVVRHHRMAPAPTSTIILHKKQQSATVLRAAPIDALEQEKATKLMLSLLIDLVGMASFALPAVGEAGDLAWAPISAALIQYLYGNALLSSLGFVEELLPGFDVIPTATIAWFITYGGKEQSQEKPDTGSSSGAITAKAPAKSFATRPDNDVIDV